MAKITKDNTPLELFVSDRGRVGIKFDGKLIPATSVEIFQDSDGFSNHAIVTIPMSIVRVGQPSGPWITWKGSPMGKGWLPHPDNVVNVRLRDGTEYSFDDASCVYRWDWIAEHKEMHDPIDIVAYQCREGV